MPIRSMLAFEPTIIVPSLTLSDEAGPPAPIWQEDVMERKKKRAVGKKVGRKAKGSEGEDLSQEQNFLDDRKAKAFRALEEACAEVEKARAEAEVLKVSLETHSFEVECLQKELREEHGEMARLRAELALEKEEKRKVQEEVNATMERALQDFKSSKDMEDIKIAFAQEAFLEGFQVCLGLIIENFFDIDVDLLLEEPENRASPLCTDAKVTPAAHAIEATPVISKSVGAAFEPALENVLTSPVGEPPENASDNQGHTPHSLVDADPLPQGVSFKPLIRGLKKKVHLLRKKLKKDVVSFSIQKGSFEKKITELKRNASDKSWALTAKISFLEADLKEAKEKNYLLEGSSPWSTEKAQYDWD
ncbi:hypothetical protein COCNU_scaffold004190G000010 [Cocos nucifera]|nr:hypothetical protein [Cocos nucifera]